MTQPRKILIIGGGASGLMAAVTAARAKAHVTVLEHQSACGKKILATGNGKCNLTNTRIYPDAYRSHAPKAVEKALRRFTAEDALAFFSGLGLHTKDKDGWIYPYSQQARTVLHLLLAEAQRLGVKLKTEVKVRKISRVSKEGRWKLTADSGCWEGDAVILAAGSKASNLPGADGSGYALAKDLGHKIYPVLPALVPLTGEGNYFRQWAGLRMEAGLLLRLDGKDAKRERGEVQLTDYGISGIPVFQLSRYAVEAIHEKRKAEMLLDFFPECSTKKLENLLVEKKNQAPHKDWGEILRGIFPDKFCPIAIRRVQKQGKSQEDAAAFPRQMAQVLKCWRLPIRGWKDYAFAQVCMGGVDLRQVNPLTLESKLHKNLYFAGEILDVDGACGGYNLQWAWSSGAVAAMAACEKGREEFI